MRSLPDDAAARCSTGLVPLGGPSPGALPLAELGTGTCRCTARRPQTRSTASRAASADGLAGAVDALAQSASVRESAARADQEPAPAPPPPVPGPRPPASPPAPGAGSGSGIGHGAAWRGARVDIMHMHERCSLPGSMSDSGHGIHVRASAVTLGGLVAQWSEHRHPIA